MPLTKSVSPRGRRAVGPALRIHRLAFDEDRGDDIVTALQVANEFIHQIVHIRPFLDVVMGIDDRQTRFQDRLGMLGQPRLVEHDLGEGRILVSARKGSSSEDFLVAVGPIGPETDLEMEAGRHIAAWRNRPRD